MKILICGFGNIGKHMYYNELGGLQHCIRIYDKYKGNTDGFYMIPNMGNENIKYKYDIAFVCVPTELADNGVLDISEVDECCKKIEADIIVIKSTVNIGTSEALSNIYNKRIVYSPEFYGTTLHALNDPDFVILSGNKQDCDIIANMYHKIKPASFKIRFTDFRTAELVKFMENSFLGLKVTFCAEFHNIATQLGVSYNELRELFVMDTRMGESHTYIDPKQPYYDSHCLNKDIPALIGFCERYQYDIPLLRMMDKINRYRKCNM